MSKKEQPSVENWVSMVGITEYLDVSRETILRWIKRGLPATKVGKVWKFKRSEVDEWIRSGALNEKSPEGDDE
jgi:excisionase family DNA binding protein